MAEAIAVTIMVVSSTHSFPGNPEKRPHFQHASAISLNGGG
jgi:hypothetical protein